MPLSFDAEAGRHFPIQDAQVVHRVDMRDRFIQIEAGLQERGCQGATDRVDLHVPAAVQDRRLDMILL